MDYKNNIEALTKSFDNMAHSYDTETNTFTHKLIEYVTFQNLIHDLPKPNQNISILDLGGGTGKYSIMLSQLGYNITLSDISEKSVIVASATLHAKGTITSEIC